MTNGPLGIPGIPRPNFFFGFTFADNFSFLLLALVFVAIVYFVSRFIVRSSFGRILKAIREDEKAIQIFGYKTIYYKLTIFVAGAMMAAVAGSLYAAYITYIDPSTFVVNRIHFYRRDHYPWWPCKFAWFAHRRRVPRSSP